MDDKELVEVQIHKEEVEGEVVEKVDIWDENEGSMATIRKSWVMRTPKKSREEKKRGRERFERKLTTIPDSQEEEMEDSQEAGGRFEGPMEEYRKTLLQAKSMPAKGSRPLVMVEEVLAVLEMKLAPLPPPNGGLEESRWKEARRDELETVEVLRRMRENRRRLHEDSDGESKDEDEDGEVEEEEEDEEMEERTGILMKTPNSRRNRAEEVLVILSNEEVLSDFRNFTA